MAKLRDLLARTTRSDDVAGVLHGAGIVLMIRVAAAPLAYVVMVVLARWMGAAEFGIYTWVFSWTMLLAIPAGLALHVCLRYLPGYLAHEQWSHLRGLLTSSVALTVLIASATSLVGAGALWVLQESVEQTLLVPFLLGLGGLPVMALVALMAQIGRAFGWVVVAYSPSQIAHPILLAIAVLLLPQTHRQATAAELLAISFALFLVAVVMQGSIYARRLGQRLRQAAPGYELRAWLRVGVPLVMVAGLVGVIDQSDLVMVGLFLTPTDVAYYSGAVRSAALVIFFFDAIMSLAGPKIAELHARGDSRALQSLLAGVIPWIALPTLAVATVILLLGVPLLAMFGEGFVAAYPGLLCLATAHLICACMGPAAILLSMTGHQDDCAKAYGVAAVANVVLNALLIPILGILGAAIATSVAKVGINAWLLRVVHRVLGLRPSIFAARSAPGIDPASDRPSGTT